jgi:hypothetical protein
MALGNDRLEEVFLADEFWLPPERAFPVARVSQWRDACDRNSSRYPGYFTATRLERRLSAGFGESERANPAANRRSSDAYGVT